MSCRRIVNLHAHEQVHITASTKNKAKAAPRRAQGAQATKGVAPQGATSPVRRAAKERNDVHPSPVSEKRSLCSLEERFVDDLLGLAPPSVPELAPRVVIDVDAEEEEEGEPETEAEAEADGTARTQEPPAEDNQVHEDKEAEMARLGALMFFDPHSFRASHTDEVSARAELAQRLEAIAQAEKYYDDDTSDPETDAKHERLAAYFESQRESYERMRETDAELRRDIHRLIKQCGFRYTDLYSDS